MLSKERKFQKNNLGLLGSLPFLGALLWMGSVFLLSSVGWAQSRGSISSRSFSPKSISHKSISPRTIQKASVTHRSVSKPRVSVFRVTSTGGKAGPLALSHNSKFANPDYSKFLSPPEGPGSRVRRTHITEVYGSARGRSVLPPLLINTFILKAQYYTPNPADENHPFQVETQEINLPLLRKNPVYWAPNQK